MESWKETASSGSPLPKRNVQSTSIFYARSTAGGSRVQLRHRPLSDCEWGGGHRLPILVQHARTKPEHVILQSQCAAQAASNSPREFIFEVLFLETSSVALKEGKASRWGKKPSDDDTKKQIYINAKGEEKSQGKELIKYERGTGTDSSSKYCVEQVKYYKGYERV
ncbi:hypothetical protein QE152_g5037 [Popillia japonica]|uniref:Uncharacterized protein n=1 Tax=Popillia japonica TaxID=7064 RepID=A0AAW1MY81_POPJA